MKTIDINCDLGEGVRNESVLMPLISSCNIACGGHAGDLETMTTVVNLAKINNVNIGAHPSFPDKENFGRAIIAMSADDLFDTLTTQIKSLKVIVEAQQLKLHHVKPHGALYNLASVDAATATVIVNVVKSIDKDLVLYAPFESVISKIAIQEGLRVMFEGFADRNYNEDLTLVLRSELNALIHDPVVMFEHVYNMISRGNVTTREGAEVPLKVDTFCMHGDEKNVAYNLQFLIKKLASKNIEIT
jgi:UPF0271 protein